MPNVSRRQMLAGGGALALGCLWPEKMFATASPISSSVLSANESAQYNVFLSAKANMPNPGFYASAATAAAIVFGQLDEIGGSALIAQAIQTAPIEGFSPALENTAYDAARALGYWLPREFFTLNGAASQLPAVVRGKLGTVAAMHATQADYVNGLRTFASAANKRIGHGADGAEIVRVGMVMPRPNRPIVHEGVATAAIAAGGVAVGGGAALISASGVTMATIATASISSMILFTGGAALVVIGVGVAGYYGYQAIQGWF